MAKGHTFQIPKQKWEYCFNGGIIDMEELVKNKGIGKKLILNEGEKLQDEEKNKREKKNKDTVRVNKGQKLEQRESWEYLEKESGKPTQLCLVLCTVQMLTLSIDAYARFILCNPRINPMK